MVRCCLACLLAVSAWCNERVAQAADRSVSLESLLDEMIDVDAAARWPQPAFTCRQESSHDRRSKTPKDPGGWFANDDNMDQPTSAWQVETREGRFEWVLLDAAGPGCVVRFWTGGSPAVGTVRFYLDGAETPAIAARLGDLLGGKAVVPRPLGIENSGAAGNLYLPIPYAKGCKITYEQGGKNAGERPPGRWYNIEYRTYPAGTAVRTFSMEQFRSLQPTVERVCKTLLNPPARDEIAARAAALDTVVEAGKEAAVDLPGGPAAVRSIELRLEGVEPEHLEQAVRSTVLRASFDGEETIWCPLGEFFGTGVGVQELSSWYRTVDKDGTMICRWTMPYGKSARIAVANFGKHKVGVQLKVRTGDWKWDARSMHFHTTWRYQNPIRTRPFLDWNYVTVTGQGTYLGDTLAIWNPVDKWWGEGDEKIWVDGEEFPSHFGTGSEDYYGYAWGNPALFQGPFCNQPRAGAGNRGHTTNTRTRVLDAIPFGKSIRTDLEIWHWADCSVAYSAASHWYALPGAKSNRGPAPDDAAAVVPGGATVIRGAVECETMKILDKSPGLAVLKQENYALPNGQWSRNAQILVQAKKPGEFIELLVAEKVGGPKKVTLYGTKSYDYGVLQFAVNGRKVAKQFDTYAPAPVINAPIELGVFEPLDGRIVLRIESVSTNPASKPPKYFFGLDAVALTAP